MATYQFGEHRGEIDGRVDEVWANAGKAVFGASGDVGFISQDGEDVIDDTIRFHHGDDLFFVLRHVVVAVGGAAPVRIAVPGAAAQHAGQ
jgi:hypothetical protein